MRLVKRVKRVSRVGRVDRRATDQKEVAVARKSARAKAAAPTQEVAQDKQEQDEIPTQSDKLSDEERRGQRADAARAKIERARNKVARAKKAYLKAYVDLWGFLDYTEKMNRWTQWIAGAIQKHGYAPLYNGDEVDGDFVNPAYRGEPFGDADLD